MSFTYDQDLFDMSEAMAVLIIAYMLRMETVFSILSDGSVQEL